MHGIGQIFALAQSSFHTPAAVRDVILAATRDEYYSVAVDAPFAGALVPPSAYRMDRRALSVMIGVNKRLYMDEHSGAKTEGFGKAHTAVGRLIMLATEATAREAPTPHGALG